MRSYSLGTLTTAALLALTATTNPSTAGFFTYDNYCQCVLGELPGVVSDSAAMQIRNKCLDDYPGKCEKETSWLSSMSPQDCTIKYAKSAGEYAGRVIHSACFHLYYNPQ
jgi:hypothetical protein